MTTPAQPAPSEGDRQVARRHALGWLSTADAARDLGGCSRAQVRKLVRLGHLQAYDASAPGSGRADWRFRQEWIDAYKATQMRVPKKASNGAA